MSGHPRVIGFLQRAVSHEFAAAQQYILHSAQADALGLGPFAKKFREEGIGEIQHAEVFLARMHAHGVTPGARSGAILPVGRTLPEMLHFAMETERQAVHLYTQASDYCDRINDTENHRVFSRIRLDEMEHLHDLEQQVRALGN